MAQLTVEQFELIRRLRNSGIDKETLLDAFDQFDEVDRIFGDVYTAPPAKRPNSQQHSNNHRHKQNSVASEDFSHQTNFPEPPNSSNLPQEVILPHLSRNGLIISAVSSSQSPKFSNTPSWSGQNQVKTEESKSESEILTEIRRFIVEHDLKMSIIANMAKVPPSGFKNYIHGNLSLVSDEVKQRIYDWYQEFKFNPSPRPAPKRKLRSAFRPSQLRILRESYLLDSYPNQMDRTEIANDCNRLFEEETGLPPDSNNIVTPIVVSNWFTKRRHLDKQKTKEEVPSRNHTPMMESDEMMKLSDGLQYESYDGQSMKVEIPESSERSHVARSPSFSPNEENESFICRENDSMFISTIKQEPPDIN